MSIINVTPEEWADALESGEYKQGHYSLRSIDHKGSDHFCCLGVLCEIMNVPRDGFAYGSAYALSAPYGSAYTLSVPPEVRPPWLTGGRESVAMRLNDADDGKSFAEIAEWIREGMPMMNMSLPEETA